MRFYLVILTLLLCFSCKEKQHELPDPLAAGWQGQAVCEVLEENQNLRVLQCTFAPGVGHEKHYHPPHFGYTLQGSTFRIVDEDGIREVEVPTGTNWASKEESQHEVLNIGDSTGVFLIYEWK